MTSNFCKKMNIPKIVRCTLQRCQWDISYDFCTSVVLKKDIFERNVDTELVVIDLCVCIANCIVRLYWLILRPICCFDIHIVAVYGTYEKQISHYYLVPVAF